MKKQEPPQTRHSRVGIPAVHGGEDVKHGGLASAFTRPRVISSGENAFPSDATPLNGVIALVMR